MTSVAGLWRLRWLEWFGAFGTLAHEAGHAAAALITGGGASLINVSSPDDGVTYHWVPSWPSQVITSVAGYATPPLLGLGAAALLAQGRVAAVLMLTVAAMALLLVVARGLVTIAITVLAGGAAFAALRWGAPLVQQALAYTLTWLLLSQIGGMRNLLSNRWYGIDATDLNPHLIDGDDADALAEATFIPGLVWIAGWAALIGWALWSAVPLLCPSRTGPDPAGNGAPPCSSQARAASLVRRRLSACSKRGDCRPDPSPSRRCIKRIVRADVSAGGEQ